MKQEGKSSKALPRVARIDIVSPDTRRLLEAKNLSAEDFSGDNRYQEFSLPLDLKRPLKLDFRIYSDGLSTFWVDWIRIERISDV